MFLFFRLLQLHPMRRPNTFQIIETLKKMRQSTATIAVQQQLNDLTGELQRLKDTNESFDDVLKNRESELQYKDQELRNKDETIAQLQRQIMEMAVRSDEIRSKDEEISKLKELLRINSQETVTPNNESNDQLNDMKATL